MIIECILISSSLCNAVAAKPKHTDVLPKRQNAIVSMLKDRPVMALATLDLTVKTMDYRQTEQDFKMGGFQEHDAMLRPMLGHPVAMAAYATAYAMGAAFLGHEMRTSRYSVIRKLWWLPQTISIEQNTFGYVYTRAHYRR
jgi:hypothetical protein